MSVTDSLVNLLGLPQVKLEEFFKSIGEKKFRAQQVMKWIYHKREPNFSKMTDLSFTLRTKLQESATVEFPEIVSRHVSVDGTRKWIIRVSSGSSIECVYIPEGNRGTLCVSSQSGCALACTFCSTGKQGFDANLTASEIIGQVWLAEHELQSLCSHGERRRCVTNVVMMGMGEPLLNFNPVVDAVNLMMNDLAFGLSKRRVTLSTSGVVPALMRLGEYTDVSLAVSLHAPNDELRNILVPINKKYPIHDLLDAITQYMGSLLDKKRVVTIEYVLLSGINDTSACARELVSLLIKVPCKINLIPFNPFVGSEYCRPKESVIRSFQSLLIRGGLNVTVRRTRGEDIDAACGQLVGKVNDRTKRSEVWRSVQGSFVKQKDAQLIAVNSCFGG